MLFGAPDAQRRWPALDFQPIALFAMGFPLLAATLGLLRWRGVLARPAAGANTPAGLPTIDSLREAA